MKSIKILTMGLMVLGVLTGVVGCAQDKPLNSLENSRVAKTSDSDEPSAQAMAFIPQQMEPIIQHLGGIENQLMTWNSNSAKSWTELTNHMVAYIEGICSNKVEEALEPTRAEYERRCKKLQAAHDGCCGWGLCLVMLLFVIAIGAFWGKLCQKRPQGNGRVRCIETSLLLAVFLLISLGAYQLTTRIVKCGVSSRASEIADAPNKHSAVLCAYNQLSDEMERWFALFAVLGTFFGLVLPVGAYFLQMRAIGEQEERVEKKISRKTDSMEEKIEQFETTLSGNTVRLQEQSDRARILQEQANTMDSKLNLLISVQSNLSQEIDKAKQTIEDLYKTQANSVFFAIIESGGQKLLNTLFVSRDIKAGLSDSELLVWHKYFAWILHLIRILGDIDDVDFVRGKIMFVLDNLESITKYSRSAIFAKLQDQLKNQYCEVDVKTAIAGSIEKLKQKFAPETQRLQEAFTTFGIDICD